jgi:hypothetical protein
MPLNPMTGQFEYGGQSYEMPTMGAGMAATGMEAVGADVPLAFRLLENMPGITALALHNARRYANTMEKGGYRDVLDPNAKVSRGKARRARRAGAMMPDDVNIPSRGLVAQTGNERFFFGRQRGAAAAGKTPFLKQSFGANFPRFRNVNRLPTVMNLPGVANAGAYTPFQGMSFLDKALSKRQFMQEARTSLGVSDDVAMLSGGVLGKLSTMGRNYNTSKQVRGRNSINPMRRRAHQRGVQTRAGINRSLAAMGQPRVPGSTINQRIAMTAPGLLTQGFLDDVASLLDGDLVSKKLIPAGFQGPSAGSQARYRSMFEKAYGGPGSKVDDAMDAINSRTVRNAAGSAFKAGEKKVAVKLAGRYAAAQYAKVSGPLNIVGTAAVAYDVGKMAATGIVSAGNFAKEAVKSMQGSMRKPLFGMGYQDNEVAATSRSRGVMAIQNSRLNARSMLGAEAGMMAAHFG